MIKGIIAAVSITAIVSIAASNIIEVAGSPNIKYQPVELAGSPNIKYQLIITA